MLCAYSPTANFRFLGSHSKIFSDGNFTAVRILHYPSIATTSLVDAPLIRCAEHTDYGELTLLFQVIVYL